ncbi:cell division protein FtsQ/DivIB [Rhodocista pekingensis]|uniref:Cell division protein FtsQ n=1 Tax=Rhodocista pekingensis TaxID=201185 RepID=A0ABW2KXR3_9PROT
MPRVSAAAYDTGRGTADSHRAKIAAAARRATMQAARRANRRRALPRWALPSLRAGLKLSPVLLLAGFLAWVWADGRLPEMAEGASEGFVRATAEAGLAVSEVLVKGRAETDGAAVLAALGVGTGSPMLTFDPHAAQAALQAIPWVAAATVERRLPGTIFVQLVERTPMALWQHEQKLYLVDADGVVLTDERLERWPDLPMLVGADAPSHGRTLLALLAAEPLIGARVEAAVLVGGRRWDLRLDNGVDVRLPEKDVAAALRQLATVQQTNRVLERDIVAVDLRVPDRLVVQTSAQAAEQRREAQRQKKI